MGEVPKYGLLDYLNPNFFSHLDWRFPCDVNDEEIHGNILTVYIVINVFLNITWLSICVHVTVILETERYLMCSLRKPISMKGCCCLLMGIPSKWTISSTHVFSAYVKRWVKLKFKILISSEDQTVSLGKTSWVNTLVYLLQEEVELRRPGRSCAVMISV